MYLWARRVLGWDASQYSIWSGADEAVHQVGIVLWVGLASFCHYSDYTVAIVGLISICLWSITLACISGPNFWWLTILATVVGSLGASTDPALRSLITSIPINSDIGKILAVLGLMESIWLIVDRSLYTHLYNTFVTTFPQVIFIFFFNFLEIIILLFSFQVNFVVQSGITTLLIFAVTLLRRDWIKRRKASDTPPNLSNNL